MKRQPTGTVTFFFTDVEGSTKLWEQRPEAMRAALSRHDVLLRDAIQANGGYIFKTIGDAFCAAFGTAPDALAAALAAQRALGAETWGQITIKVRIGLHTGTADTREGDYFGPTLNRVARLMSAGHGGQVLLSLATQELVRDQLPQGVSLRDMGERRLKDLIRPEHVFQVVAPGLPESFPPLRTLDYRPNNLPAQTTSFIGREAELAQVREMLLQPELRLLTLSGSGGMGKTRLALQAAADMLDDFENGVFFAALAPVSDPASVIPTIAQALDVREAEGQSLQRRLRDYLREKHMLLVLDNFEQIVEAAPAVTELLSVAPRLKILVTSRASLRISGEHIYSVPPLLDLPDPKKSLSLEQVTQYTAVQLFIERAKAVEAGFTVTNDNAPAVAEICYRLEGLPLAIELAATWAQMLTPDEILAELGQSLDFLETDLRDVPERHRSLRAVFDYSWNLLTEGEREVFRALSVFRGGFTREAAQAVAGASLRALRALVTKSLIHLMPTGRYEIHELLRQYGQERLNQVPDKVAQVYARHCAYYVAALQRWEKDLRGPRQKAAMDEMKAEGENAHAAWSWAVTQGQVAQLYQGIEGLCLLHSQAGRYQAGEAACRAAVDGLKGVESGEGIRTLARILAWQSRFSRILGNVELAEQSLQQGIALLEVPAVVDYDTRAVKAHLLLEMGEEAFEYNREQAKRLYKQSLSLYRELEAHPWIAYLLFRLGDAAWADGAYDQAKPLFEQSLAIRKELGAPGYIASSLFTLCYTAMYQGQLEQAERLAQDTLVIRRELDDRVGIAAGLETLGETRLWQGKFAEACALLEECIAIYDDLGLHSSIVGSKAFLNQARLHLGLYEQVRVGEELTWAQEIDFGYLMGLLFFVMGCQALVEGTPIEAQKWLKEGVAVDRRTGQRNEEGQALAVLALAAHKLGQAAQARHHLTQALQIAIETGAFQPPLYALPAIALLCAESGEPERALEFHTLATSNYPFVANSRWFEDVVGQHVAAVTAGLLPDANAVADAQERGRGRDLQATVAELLAELEGEGYGGGRNVEGGITETRCAICSNTF